MKLTLTARPSCCGAPMEYKPAHTDREYPGAREWPWPAEWECAKCGGQITADEPPEVDDTPHVYCPRCGDEIPADNSECGCEDA